MADPGYLLLVRDGDPVGQGRPRFVKATGRAFADKQTESVVGEWKHLWAKCGRVRLDGPLALTVVARFARPRSHYLGSGALTSAGQRIPRPGKRPDLSNIVKLVEDALNGLAYEDDAQIVDVRAAKVWTADRALPPQTVVLIKPADPFPPILVPPATPPSEAP